MTIDDRLVLAQARKFTAVLENEPATAYPPKNPELIFASPCPMSSRFARTFCFVCVATSLATLTLSVKPISHIITEKMMRSMICPILKASNSGVRNGIERLGSH